MGLGTMLIRADASPEIGTGHVMRCLALAQAWQDAGGQAVFLFAQCPEPLFDRVNSENFSALFSSVTAGSAEDAQATINTAASRGAHWVVLDGYEFKSHYQCTVKSAGLRLLCVDDNAEIGRYHADLVLNQNLHASEAMYSGSDESAHLLLGPTFALLRREFKVWQGWNRQIAPVARKIMISMGGADPRELTSRVLDAVDLIADDDIEVRVAVGRSNPRIAEIRRRAGNSHHCVSVELDANMPELMAWADWALAAAGSTCWEMCFLGLPAIVIDVAENQRRLARELDRRRCAIHLPGSEATPMNLSRTVSALSRDEDLRTVLSQNCSTLVDGRGARRVIKSMITCDLTMRAANRDDCRLLWEWANSEVVRRVSFSSDPIPWEQHVRWFSERLNDSGSTLLIVLYQSRTPTGVVRIQRRSACDAEISITIAPEWRGCGIAAWAIEKAVAYAFEKSSAQRIHAYIKPNNLASLKTFESAGFSFAGETEVNGIGAVAYVRERNDNVRGKLTESPAEVVPCG